MAVSPRLGPSLDGVRLHVKALIPALVATLALAACGGDDSPVSFEPDDGVVDGFVTVIGSDIAFDRDDYVAAAGPVEITLANEGSIVHSLVIEDVDGLRLVVNSKGDEDTGTIDLDAGEYVVYCDIAGHRSAGMEATLTVE